MTTDTTATDPTAQRRPHNRDRLAMPENHLDAVVAPDSIEPTRKATLRTQLFAVILLPLFLMSGFSIAYNSAQHAPAPHDMALVVAGPSATTSQIAKAIDSRASGAFDITQTSSASTARRLVEQRTAVGAVVVEGRSVTTIIASAAGRISVGPIEQVGQQVASEMGTTAKVSDVAPVSTEDTSGTALFYYLLLCTVGGYMSMTVISQVLRNPRLRTMVATAFGAAVLAPLIGFAMLSIFVGDFGASFGSIAATIGVAMVYTLTVGLLATFLTRALGQGAIFAVLVILMFLNFPSTGGSAPESMLPGFWQAIHNTWIGSGAFEAMRSLVYFHGHQFGRWFAQLSIWAGSVIVLNVLLAAAQRRRGSAAGGPAQPDPSQLERRGSEAAAAVAV